MTERLRTPVISQLDDVPGAAAMARDLRTLLEGEVTFDRFSRALYSTDASIYRIPPIGVVHPRHEADIVALVEYAVERGIPVLPRGGGTSLAGQCVGKAIVLDLTTHMNQVLEVQEGRVRVQPGLVLAVLNDHLRETGWFFAPDPASGNRATIGGMIGNNSTGAHSLRYGMTTDYLEALRVVVGDGTVLTTRSRDLPADEETGIEAALLQTVHRLHHEHRDRISRRYPKLQRNVSGYDLRRAVDGDRVDLSRLVCGSEGTLGIVTEATLRLERIPEEKQLVLLCFESIVTACETVPAILEHEPAACELVDRPLIELARSSAAHAETAALLPEGVGTVLFVEFQGEEAGAVRSRAETLAGAFTPEPAFEAIPAFDASLQKRLWGLRKAGLGILASKPGDEKHVTFIEDSAVPVRHLGEFVARFQEILTEHGTHASFYGHAGPGVLHARPLLNLKRETHVEAMARIGDAVIEMVLEYGGAVSGEHGDGQARSQYLERMYGAELCRAFRTVKESFDPAGIFNPGKIVAPEADMRRPLRFGPEYRALSVGTSLSFEREGGFGRAVEMCNGSGDCRNILSNVMCPTFRPRQDDILTTRGRANLLREALSGGLPEEVLFSKPFKEEVMDLCIGCKGCKHDCPSSVDMAKLKIGWKEAYHAKHGPSLRELFFGHIDRIQEVLRRFGRLFSNVAGTGWARKLGEQFLGIHPSRQLPALSGQTLRHWFTHRRSKPRGPFPRGRVAFFADCNMALAEPAVGRAAIRLLEACGYEVQLPRVVCCGRPPLSQGLVGRARRLIHENLKRLRRQWGRDIPILGTEPSCVDTLATDAIDVVGEAARPLNGVRGVLDFLAREGALEELLQERQLERLLVHGHCHQKAAGKVEPMLDALRQAAEEVRLIPATCCGMAGAFGYEEEHYEMSMAIGRILKKTIGHLKPGTVLAPGTSCRAQLRDLGEEVQHPVEWMAETVSGFVTD